MNAPPEMYGLGGIALAIIAILSLFVRSLVKNQRSIIEATLERQDQMFVWFTEKMNGSLEALKASLEANKHATEHNTANLKTIRELSSSVFSTMMTSLTEQEKTNSELVLAKLDELLERDRSQTRLDDLTGTDSPQP